MKKVNFNNLDNIQIPESWTKSALSLPETLENKKKVVYFSRFSKNLALVASLVLVCALSVSLFIFTQKGDILNAHKPSQNSESTTVTQTEHTNQNVSEVSPATETQEKTQQTESSTSTEPTQKVTEETVTETQKATAPTLKPDTSDPDASDPNSVVPPTQKPTPTEPPETPQAPEEAPEVEFDGKITVQFPSSHLSGNGYVYCQIYDGSNTLLGDSNPYSDTHRAFLTLPSAGNSSFSYVTATYNIDKGGFSLSKGTYRYCFYNENGETICNGLFDVY
ncbi:MAG: hypothetical protein IJO20_01425 [Ruminococcus sp.]|nr:hypothetical protein [Ruminococcus sp.]